MAADRELADLYLAQRLPAWRVREAIGEAAPAGIAVVAVHDVWLGVPALTASVAVADYRIVLSGDARCDPAALREVAARLLSAATLERRRPRGSDSVTYDLRPLLDSIRVLDGHPVVVEVRTRFHPERGAGRPDEVLAALSERLGTPLPADDIVRERVLLGEDLEPPPTFDARGA
jgi:hypothetical protein